MYLGTTQRPTYIVVVRNLTIVDTATCVVSISGASGKVIRIVEIEGVVTTSGNQAGLVDISFIKRSTLNTGGTFTTLTPTSLDSGDAVSTAVIQAYTANPATLGTSLGILNTHSVRVNPTGDPAIEPQDFAEYYNNFNAKPPTLRDTNELIEINFNGATIAGTQTGDFYITYTESTT